MSERDAKSIAFVRETSLPQALPPAAERGIYTWCRENLFATPANGLLTLVSFYVIYLVLTSTMPWIFNGIWNTQSLAACREALAGETGACFSVLSERWNQLLFGFKYPPDQYWRPGLAFALLFFAAAPVLFFDLPRKLLIATALYPFVAYWLIWGGTIWTPVMALVGVIVGYRVYAMLVTQNFAAGFFPAHPYNGIHCQGNLLANDRHCHTALCPPEETL